MPTIVQLEVTKWVLRTSRSERAAAVLALMSRGEVASWDPILAAGAAQYGLEYSLPVTDSVIYATAQAHDAVLWTMDQHFKELPGVRYLDRA